MFKRVFFLFMTISAMSNFANSGDNTGASPQPPVAKRVPHDTKVNGVEMHDPYFWLREKLHPDVKAYVEAENAYTDALMAPNKPFEEDLYKELLSHIKETDDSYPYREGGYYYYDRTVQGKQYVIHCRRKGSMTAPEEVTLDVNALAQGEKFMSVAQYNVSDDGNLLAYTTDNTGYRQYRLHIRDLRTGKDFPESTERVGSVAWANDKKTIFYTVEDDVSKRQFQLYRHTVGTPTSSDKLVYEEKDEMFVIEVGKTRSNKFIVLQIGSHTTSEARYIPADQPNSEWKLIAPRVPNEEYFVDHHGDSFYIRTNKDGRNYELVTAPIATPDRAHWKVVIPHRADVMLSDTDMFAKYAVLIERENGLPQLTVYDMSNLTLGAGKKITFPEPAYTVQSSVNREWDATEYRYGYQSPITPPSTYYYDMAKHTSALKKQNEVPGGFDRNNYVVERVFAPAKDGAKVPITIFYRKGVKKDSTAPLYLYAYGSYGISIPDSFSSSRLALMDRGMVLSIAHIRGGGEMGKPWHDAGRMMNKMNTFTDFIASAEFLIAQKYCDPKKIVIEGGSAGGLLMGAVTNLRPDLWRAVLSKVPFVDVMNTMLDASLPLTVGEYEEWGNPNEKPAFDYMMTYSPYDNLAKKNYPTILIKTSFNDSQVMYWEPAKYTAKLRTLKTDTNPLMLKTNMNAGHGGSSGRYDFLHDTAFDYAYLLTQVGIDK